MTMETTVEKTCATTESRKKIRHRKKQHYLSIMKQMEFYFGDANLSKDRFLGTLIKNDPYIPLSTFLKFNKIKALTDNIEDIAKSIASSEFLKLSEDETKVCRTTTIKERTNVDECTVYVECLPPNIDHEWLRNLFITFGPVSYVSLPRFKHNRKIKGFAFIEFEEPSSAKKCLEAFEKAGSKLLPLMNPDDLCSITSFEDPNQPSSKTDCKESSAGEDNQEDSEMAVPDSPTQKSKRKLSESSENPSEIQPKKKTKANKETNTNSKTPEVRADESSSSSESDSEKLKENCDNDEIKQMQTDESLTLPNPEPNNENIHGNQSDNNNMLGTDSELNEAETSPESKKKKRKRKKQVKKYRESIASTGLKILSKKEWKSLRNKYLNLQRTKMRQLKKQLHLNRVHEKSEHSTKYQQNFYGGNSSEPNNEDVITSATVEFTPGVIVLIKLKEPCVDVKRFKAALKDISEEIKYVDINEGYSEAHLRFSDNANAQKFSTLLEEASSIHTPDIIEMVNQVTSQLILTGDMEQEYWKKISRDRDNKRNKKVKLDRRGKDKLISKAAKNSHVHFDD